jgi:uncharacterized protein (DUF4415 family)
MPRKNASGESAWVDPDDAPELDDAFFAEADHRRNGELIQRGRGRPKLARGKALVSIRLDQDVLEGLRDLGAGWQTKANAALKEWLKRTH